MERGGENAGANGSEMLEEQRPTIKTHPLQVRSGRSTCQARGPTSSNRRPVNTKAIGDVKASGGLGGAVPRLRQLCEMLCPLDRSSTGFKTLSWSVVLRGSDLGNMFFSSFASQLKQYHLRRSPCGFRSLCHRSKSTFINRRKNVRRPCLAPPDPSCPSHSHRK